MVTVITSITAGKDRLIDDQPRGGAAWIAFLEIPQASSLWRVRPAYDRFRSPRRNSRAPKILPHLFVDAECSLWIDANVQLLAPPQSLVAMHLQRHDIALFRHPLRDCIYAEAEECIRLGLDDPDLIRAQMREYAAAGYPAKRGLCENNFILRRHTKKVRRLNEAWWAEYCGGAVRDQLSFMVAADRAGVDINILDAPLGKPPLYGRAGIFSLRGHLTPRPERTADTTVVKEEAPRDGGAPRRGRQA
jgi:hypothetical protein